MVKVLVSVDITDEHLKIFLESTGEAYGEKFGFNEENVNKMVEMVKEVAQIDENPIVDWTKETTAEMIVEDAFDRIFGKEIHPEQENISFKEDDITLVSEEELIKEYGKFEKFIKEVAESNSEFAEEAKELLK